MRWAEKGGGAVEIGGEKNSSKSQPPGDKWKVEQGLPKRGRGRRPGQLTNDAQAKNALQWSNVGSGGGWRCREGG